MEVGSAPAGLAVSEMIWNWPTAKPVSSLPRIAGPGPAPHLRLAGGFDAGASLSEVHCSSSGADGARQTAERRSDFLRGLAVALFVAGTTEHCLDGQPGTVLGVRPQVSVRNVRGWISPAALPFDVGSLEHLVEDPPDFTSGDFWATHFKLYCLSDPTARGG